MASSYSRIGSGLKALDLAPGETYWHCPGWTGDDEFESVVTVQRAGPHWTVRYTTGPRMGETATLKANALWPEDRLPLAREYRDRDRAIHRLVVEDRNDAPTRKAMELVADLVTGDTVLDTVEVVCSLMRRLGWGDDLSALHDLAYDLNGMGGCPVARRTS